MDANKSNKICEAAEKQIDMLLAKPDMSATDIDALGELIDIIKDLDMISTSHMPNGTSGASMPYYGFIGYDDSQWKKDRGSSYGTPRYDGSSYGRVYDGRMMPRVDW